MSTIKYAKRTCHLDIYLATPCRPKTKNKIGTVFCFGYSRSCCIPRRITAGLTSRKLHPHYTASWARIPLHRGSYRCFEASSVNKTLRKATMPKETKPASNRPEKLPPHRALGVSLSTLRDLLSPVPANAATKVTPRSYQTARITRQAQHAPRSVCDVVAQPFSLVLGASIAAEEVWCVPVVVVVVPYSVLPVT